MKSVIFTYYSSLLSEVFIQNVMSMIRNSDKYDELVICSRVEVPNQILAALRQMIKTTRVQPAFTQAKIHAQHSAVNRINPLMVSALTYQDAFRKMYWDYHHTCGLQDWLVENRSTTLIDFEDLIKGTSNAFGVS